MADLPTRLDLFQLGADYVLQRATKIDPQQVYVQGSDVNLFCGITAQVAYAIILQLAYRTNALLLDGAEDEDLDRYAWDRYGLTRKGANAAVGTVRLYRDVGGTAGTVPVGTKLTSLTGIEYITTGNASFGVATLSVSVNVRATSAGKSQQVGANNIRKFSDQTSLFDTTLKVNNDLPTAHGEDAEDDETFRNRIRDFWSTVRRGTLGAIEYGARTVPGIDSASAVEVTTQAGVPARVVILYIADSSGVASEAMADTVRTALLDYRAAGIQVIVVVSMPQIVDILLKLSFQSGVDTDSLTTTIRNAVVEYVNSIPVSATLLRSALYSLLQRYTADGLIVGEDTLVAPAGDLVPAAGMTLRTTLTNVTVA